jgi:hypothetical protein
MLIEVLRVYSNDEATLGHLFINNKFQCFTLEDQYRAKKVYADTRIPAGLYDITYRTVGGMHTRYKDRFPHMHQGMLWVRNVPGFEYILIHMGNYESQTAGCLLVGMDAVLSGTHPYIAHSRMAYEKIYPIIASALNRGEHVVLSIVDIDRMEEWKCQES